MRSTKQIDSLLTDIENVDENIEDKKKEYLETIHNILGLSSTEKPINALFDQTNSTEQKKFIAVCLLRLICHRKETVWDWEDVRVRTFRLFDEQIYHIYSKVDIEKDSGNHVKLSKLCDLEAQVLRSFDDLTRTIVS